MTRPLAFDYAFDPAVLDLKDEFMLGKSLLVAPVTTPMYYGPESTPLDNTDKARSVYLPKGKQWYDFHDGTLYDGGQTIQVEAPLHRIPVFVPSGSILPLCTDTIEYAAQYATASWEVRVYPGADATFTLYEDAGDGYAYEQGEFSTIELVWNDRARTLTLSTRRGGYLPQSQLRLAVVLPDGTSRSVTYVGMKEVVKF